MSSHDRTSGSPAPSTEGAAPPKLPHYAAMLGTKPAVAFHCPIPRHMTRISDLLNDTDGANDPVLVNAPLPISTNLVGVAASVNPSRGPTSAVLSLAPVSAYFAAADDVALDIAPLPISINTVQAAASTESWDASISVPLSGRTVSAPTAFAPLASLTIASPSHVSTDLLSSQSQAPPSSSASAPISRSCKRAVPVRKGWTGWVEGELTDTGKRIDQVIIFESRTRGVRRQRNV
jgi:hypothetical protein